MIGILAVVTAACGGDGPDPSASPELTATALTSPSPTGATTTATAPSTPTTTPSPTAPSTPTPTAGTPGSGPSGDPLSRTSLTLDPGGTAFTEAPVAVSRSRSSSGSCPIAPEPNITITACATANAAGGTIGATVEEDDSGSFFATVYKETGASDPWEPVTQTPIYDPSGGGPRLVPDRITPAATGFLEVFNFLSIAFEMPGSGGHVAYELVDWPRGAADPQVAATVARPGAAVTDWAGTLLLDAAHLAEDDPGCCPSERELMMIEHPDGRTSVPAVSTVVSRGETTPELLARDVYRAWIDADLASLSSRRLASQPRRWLRNHGGGGGQDDHVFTRLRCPWTGGAHACELTAAPWTLTWRIEPGSTAGTHRLVRITQTSP